MFLCEIVTSYKVTSMEHSTWQAHHEHTCLNQLLSLSREDNLVKNALCDIYDLYNIISELTCVKRPVGTLIDPIIVSSNNRFRKSINVFCDYSDPHNLVGCIT